MSSFLFALAACKKINISTIRTSAFRSSLGQLNDIITVRTPQVVHTRLFNNLEVNERLLNKYRTTDGVGPDYKIVYRAPALKYINYAHFVSFISLIAAPTISIISYCFNGPISLPVRTDSMIFVRSFVEYGIFYLALFLFISQIAYIVSSYPLRIYSNQKGHYIAVYRSYLRWTLNNKGFKAGEMKKVENSYLFMGDNLYKFGTKRAILIEDNFHRPVDLKNMLEPFKESNQ